MTQYDIILDAMLSNPSKKWWYAKDFQYGQYFVGYEATARMSELVSLYPTLFEVAKDGRFRIIAIDWSKEEEIASHKKRIEDIKEMEGKING